MYILRPFARRYISMILLRRAITNTKVYNNGWLYGKSPKYQKNINNNKNRRVMPKMGSIHCYATNFRARASVYIICAALTGNAWQNIATIRGQI